MPRQQTLVYELTSLLLTVSDDIRARGGPVTKELGLNGALVDMLLQIDPSIPPTLRRLAVLRRCDPSTITQLADGLQRRGLVERQEVASDRRARRLAITPAGIEVRDRLVASTVADSPMSRLSPAEQRLLARLLRKAAGPQSTMEDEFR